MIQFQSNLNKSNPIHSNQIRSNKIQFVLIRYHQKQSCWSYFQSSPIRCNPKWTFKLTPKSTKRFSIQSNQIQCKRSNRTTSEVVASWMDVNTKVIQQNVPGSENSHNQDGQLSVQLNPVHLWLIGWEDGCQPWEDHLCVEVFWMWRYQDISGYFEKWRKKERKSEWLNEYIILSISGNLRPFFFQSEQLQNVNKNRLLIILQKVN